MRPEHGVRYELRLSNSSEPKAEYRLCVATAERELYGVARIDTVSGQLELDWPDAGALPEGAERALRALLRALHREQQSNGEWPRRVTRWRGESEP